MAVKRSTSVRTKLGATLMLMGLLSAILGAVAGAVDLSPDPGGANTGGFEVDGNLVVDGTGTTDWASFVGSAYVGVDDTHDSGVGGQENEPENYKCNGGGANPGKANFLRVYGNTRVEGGKSYLDLAYVRDATRGDTYLNFEFNRNPAAGYQFPADIDTPEERALYATSGAPQPCPFVNREVGDLLIAYSYPGGADPASITLHDWDGDNWIAIADILLPDPLGAGTSADGNVQSVVDPFGFGTFDGRAFGEFSINLAMLDYQMGGGLGCPGFATLNVRSRSSSAVTSSLQDRLETTPFDVSNCASIKIKKVDDSQPAVAQQGAVYGLYDSLAKAQAVASQTDAAAIAAAVSTCITGVDGTCVLDSADPDQDYWITEITPPAGLLPSTEVRAVSKDDLDLLTELDLTGTPFVNDVPVGNVTVIKRLFEGNDEVTPDQLSDLDGITFTLEQSSATAKTHPAGSDATCTIVGGAGECTISSVRLGTYQITETLPATAPDGMGVGTSPSVTLTTHGQTVTAYYDNPLSPLQLTLDKAGPDTAVIGDVITYTFTITTTGPALTITSIEEVTEPPNFADRCDTSALTAPAESSGDGDALLEVGEVWGSTCQHTVTAADVNDADGANLQNKARVTAKDAVGRTVVATDTHTVAINLPGVSIVKTTSTPVVDSGEEVRFRIVVENDGNADATDVAFADDLPDGVSWSIDGVTPAGCGLDASNDLACSGLTVPADGSVQIDLVGTSDADDCPSITNPSFTMTAQNDVNPQDNQTVDVTIAVRCPDVRVTKVADAASIDAGDEAGFTITVTNDGPGAAHNVSFDDVLPAGVSWSMDPAVPGCAITGSTLSCSFATLASGASKTIHVVGTTDNAECPSITNPSFTASARNEAQTALGNNTPGDVTITVTCALPPLPPPPPPPAPVLDPLISLVKDGPAFAHRGDTITYTFVVKNTGQTALVNVTLIDPICDEGTIQQLRIIPAPSTTAPSTTAPTTTAPTTTAPTTTQAPTTTEGFQDASLGASDVLVSSAVLNVGDVWELECTRIIRDDDPDPLPNTARVVGTEVVPTGSSATNGPSLAHRIFAAPRTVFAEDDHLVDLLNPGIGVVKTVDDATPALGQTITFTYRVTNTGDADLVSVTVVDDQLGLIGTIARLEQGESVLLTKTMVVAADSPLINIATASGSDELGRVVEGIDDATITIVGGTVVEPIPLPRTGAESRVLLLLAGALLLIGGVLIATDGQLTARHAARDMR